MKKQFGKIFFSFFILHSQINLVPNPSFEIYDTCPDNASQVNRVINWFSCYTTPDYYNTCSSVMTLPSYPPVFYQQPFDGNGIIGLYSVVNPPSREYILIVRSC